MKKSDNVTFPTFFSAYITKAAEMANTNSEIIHYK